MKLITLMALGILSAAAYMPVHAKTLQGYVSNACDREGFLSEVEDRYPCWYSLCYDTLRWKSEKYRKQYWFENTFYTGRDRKIRKAIEALARTHGIVL